MLLRYCLIDFEVVPFTPIITDIIFAFTFHTREFYFMMCLYSKKLSDCIIIIIIIIIKVYCVL